MRRSSGKRSDSLFPLESQVFTSYFPLMAIIEFFRQIFMERPLWVWTGFLDIVIILLLLYITPFGPHDPVHGAWDDSPILMTLLWVAMFAYLICRMNNW